MTSHSGLIFEPWEKYVGNWHGKQIGALSKWSQGEGKIKLGWLKQEGNNDGRGTNPAGEGASTVSLGRHYNGTYAKRQATCKQKSSRFPMHVIRLRPFFSSTANSGQRNSVCDNQPGRHKLRWLLGPGVSWTTQELITELYEYQKVFPSHQGDWEICIPASISSPSGRFGAEVRKLFLARARQ